MFRLALVVCSIVSGCRLDEGGLGGDPITLDEGGYEEVRPDSSPVHEDTLAPDTFVADTASADTIVADVAPDVTVACSEPGAKLWSGHCYFALTVARAFTAQRDACIAAGAHLASITSAEEQAIVAAQGTADRWIGLLKDASLPSAKSSFRWISGESADVYDNWAPGDPNGGHNCARMMANGTWGDQACANAFPAVCERE